MWIGFSRSWKRARISLTNRELLLRSMLGTSNNLAYQEVGPRTLATLSSLNRRLGIDSSVSVVQHSVPEVFTLRDGSSLHSHVTTGYLFARNLLSDAFFAADLPNVKVDDSLRRVWLATLLHRALVAQTIRRGEPSMAIPLILSGASWTHSGMILSDQPLSTFESEEANPAFPSFGNAHVTLNRRVAFTFPVAHELAHALGRDRTTGVMEVLDSIESPSEFARWWRALSTERRGRIGQECSADAFAAEAILSAIAEEHNTSDSVIAELPAGVLAPTIVDNAALSLLAACIPGFTAALVQLLDGLRRRDATLGREALFQPMWQTVARLKTLAHTVRDNTSDEFRETLLGLLDHCLAEMTGIALDLLDFLLSNRTLYETGAVLSREWLSQLLIVSQAAQQTRGLGRDLGQWLPCLKADADRLDFIEMQMMRDYAMVLEMAARS